MERVSVIFLDIDNVLNYGPVSGKDLPESSQYGFDDGLCNNLKKILDSVENCRIVISSSWRCVRTMDQISKTENWRSVLERKLGVPNGTILGDVPMVNEFDPSRYPKGRGDDIKAWLDTYNKVYAVGYFVILDDSVSCGNIPKVFPNNYVDCDANQTLMGLSDKKVKEAIWILTGYGREKKMDNVWFVSDTHFNHRNIIRYCKRPWNSGYDSNGEMIITDEDVERMNEDLIKNWNSVVGKNDICWHLGDFALGDRKKIPEIVSRLNGKINLVLGNHDHVKIKDMYEAGFHRVYDRPVIINKFFVLSHAPMEWVKDGDVMANLYGHVHSMEMYRHYTRNTFNCCVEVNDYRPVSWKEIISKMESYENGPEVQ